MEMQKIVNLLNGILLILDQKVITYLIMKLNF